MLLWSFINMKHDIFSNRYSWSNPSPKFSLMVLDVIIVAFLFLSFHCCRCCRRLRIDVSAIVVGISTWDACFYIVGSSVNTSSQRCWIFTNARCGTAASLVVCWAKFPLAALGQVTENAKHQFWIFKYILYFHKLVISICEKKMM